MPVETSCAVDTMTADSRRADTIVDILRRRAREQPDETAYIFLVEGETEERRVTYAAARSSGADDRRPSADRLPARRSRAAAVPAGPRIHRGVFRLPLRRADRRARVPSSQQVARAADRGHHGRRRGVPRVDDGPHARDGATAHRAASVLRDLAVDGHRRSRRSGRTAAGRRHVGHSRLAAVHVGLDRHAERRDGQPRQYHLQLSLHPAVVLARSPQRLGVVVAKLSRHGPHRRRGPADLHRVSRRHPAAGQLRAEAGAVARGDREVSRHALWQPELRLRAVRAEDSARAERGARPALLGERVQRRRAGATGIRWSALPNASRPMACDSAHSIRATALRRRR